jgi:hypothetical protein
VLPEVEQLSTYITSETQKVRILSQDALGTQINNMALEQRWLNNAPCKWKTLAYNCCPTSPTAPSKVVLPVIRVLTPYHAIAG